jgi:hypothetical protein
MKIKPIKNPGGVSDGCVDTILGTARCLICNQQMFVEVAKVGDAEETAMFIYHKKPGGEYCSGSNVEVKKLEGNEIC